MRVLDRDAECVNRTSYAYTRLHHVVPVTIAKLNHDRRCVVHINFDRKCCVLVIVVQVGLNLKVFDMELGKRKKVDIAEDTTNPPLVLYILSRFYNIW